MPLSKIIRKNVIYCELDTIVADVASEMRDEDVGAVLVLQGGIPKGIITDRDIVLRCVAEQRSPQRTVAAEVMTPSVETVSLEDGIYDVAQKMKKAQVRRIAVVDSAGNAAGLVSFDDLFELITDELHCMRDAILPIKPKIIRGSAA